MKPIWQLFVVAVLLVSMLMVFTDSVAETSGVSVDPVIQLIKLRPAPRDFFAERGVESFFATTGSLQASIELKLNTRWVSFLCIHGTTVNYIEYYWVLTVNDALLTPAQKHGLGQKMGYSKNGPPKFHEDGTYPSPQEQYQKLRQHLLALRIVHMPGAKEVIMIHATARTFPCQRPASLKPGAFFLCSTCTS